MYERAQNGQGLGLMLGPPSASCCCRGCGGRTRSGGGWRGWRGGGWCRGGWRSRWWCGRVRGGGRVSRRWNRSRNAGCGRGRARCRCWCRTVVIRPVEFDGGSGLAGGPRGRRGRHLDGVVLVGCAGSDGEGRGPRTCATGRGRADACGKATIIDVDPGVGRCRARDGDCASGLTGVDLVVARNGGDRGGGWCLGSALHRDRLGGSGGHHAIQCRRGRQRMARAAASCDVGHLARCKADVPLTIGAHGGGLLHAVPADIDRGPGESPS